MTVELPLDLDLSAPCSLQLALDVATIFSANSQVLLAEGQSTTHSRADDPLATRLHGNVERAFQVASLRQIPTSTEDLVEGSRSVRLAAPLMAARATPFPFTYSALFPRPALPLDNPLTQEGVGLGRALFHEKMLSINNQQACASCHDLAHAGADPQRPFSFGAEGELTPRNAMPLFNLAWKNTFFWDGRAATLRDQVLQPIQNPTEMHETLPHVVAKLEESLPSRYPDRFARAFGSPEISADRIARALEQFLLAEVSHRSEFDRVMQGEAEFTAEEERGFELFQTEYDPRREQYGADCFHCHGGPLFQSVAFANNGLDRAPDRKSTRLNSSH